jgi:hypothetical protein
MASHHPLGPLVIHPQERSLPPQHRACPQRWNLKARALQLDQDRQQDEAPTCFWLSCVCVGEQSGSKKFNTTLATMCTPRHQSRPQSFACQKNLPDAQPKYRICLSTVSLQIERLLRDSKTWWPDIRVPTAWQQLSGLTVMTQTPSMDKAPSPSQCTQFGNTMVVPAESSDSTIFVDDTSDTPIFFDQPVQDFNDNHSVAMANEGGTASHQSS